jgi:hypothetical protein
MPPPRTFNPRQMMEKAVAVMRQSVNEPRPDKKASPLVGAVLVKPDGTVDTAYRGELRHGDHAEFTLLERKHRDERTGQLCTISGGSRNWACWREPVRRGQPNTGFAGRECVRQYPAKYPAILAGFPTARKLAAQIWNPGELPSAITTEGLRAPHPSIPRNPLIAEPIFLTRYIERAGSDTLNMIANTKYQELVGGSRWAQSTAR